MPEAACASFGVVEVLHMRECGFDIFLDYHLADALAVFDCEWLARQDDEDDFCFIANHFKIYEINNNGREEKNQSISI